MPIEWVLKQEKAPEKSGAFMHETGCAPAYQLHLWPHRSLPRRGFAGFIGTTAFLFLMPLLALLGSPVLWGILPFFALALWGIWYSLQRNYRDGELIEDLCLWSDRIELVRHNPRSARQDWSANPHWVSLHIQPEGGPVPQYLTLKGAGREVEIGAFLSPDERAALHAELERAIRSLG